MLEAESFLIAETWTFLVHVYASLPSDTTIPSSLIRFSCVQVLRPLKVQLLILTPPLAIDLLHVIVQSWCKMAARSRQNVTFCWVKYAINTLRCANVDGYSCEWRTNATNNRVSHYNRVQTLKRVKIGWPFPPHINPEMTSHYVSKGHMNRRVATAGVTQHSTAILGATCWCLVQSSVLSLLCWIQLEGCYCTGSTVCLGLQKKDQLNASGLVRIFARLTTKSHKQV